MPRSFQSSKKLRGKQKLSSPDNISYLENESTERENLVFYSRKGQWFLLSAVITTGVFLAVSGLFKIYLTVDPSLNSRSNEDLFFFNVKEQFSSVVAKSPCSELDRNLREFRAFSQKEMANKGYFLYLNYSISGCSVSQPGIVLASEKMVLCQNVNLNDVITNTTVTCPKI